MKRRGSEVAEGSPLRLNGSSCQTWPIPFFPAVLPSLRSNLLQMLLKLLWILLAGAYALPRKLGHVFGKFFFIHASGGVKVFR